MCSHSLTQLSPEKSKWLMYKLAAAAAHMHHKSPALFTFLVSSSAIHNSGRQMSNDTLSHPAPLRPSCVCVPYVNALLPDTSTPLVKPSTFVLWSHTHKSFPSLSFPSYYMLLMQLGLYTLPFSSYTKLKQ